MANSRTNGDIKSVVQSLKSVQWDFEAANTSHSAHAIQPYPAKFPPQIPEHLIGILSQPGTTVLDCFGGCGTSAVEAVRLGRRAYVIDANPVATLLTEVKTSGVALETKESVKGLIEQFNRPGQEEKIAVSGTTSWRPSIPNIERWYSPFVVDELAGLRGMIEEFKAPEEARRLALSAFANVASRMSFQESETRYKSVPRNIPPGQAIGRLVSELNRHLEELENVVEASNHTTVIHGDAREMSSYPKLNSIGLAVTSPPYPNAYDYHLYHRFRIFWLGQDPASLRDVEIGSHLTNQSTRDPILKYEADMAKVISNVFGSLMPGGYAAFVVGSGVHRGEVYDTQGAMIRLGRMVGFDHVITLQRNLPTLRRSVTVAGRRLNVEDIVILRKPTPTEVSEKNRPPYEMYPYEESLRDMEMNALRKGTTRQLKLGRQAAFSYLVTNGREVDSTFQRIAEYSGTRSIKKHSTYAGHGLHRYKGKFYPQLAKSLINVTDAYSRPGVILDPFGGSGTVATEARIAGLTAVSIDVNPLAVEVAKAKIALLEVSVDELHRSIDAVSKRSIAASKSIDWSQFDESTHAELESWFPKASLAKLSHLLGSIRSVCRKESADGLRLILEAMVSDLIREISHQEPTDLRIRRRSVDIDDAPVIELFGERSSKIVQRREYFQHRLDLGPELGVAKIVHGNAATEDPYEEVDALGGIAAVVSSPPYGVALPYLDTDRLSLAAIYGYDKRTRAQLESRLIGSREISGRDRASWEAMLSGDGALNLPSSTLTFVASLFQAVQNDPHAGFRKQQTPSVLLRYFVSMNDVLIQIEKRANRRSEMALVLGNSHTTVGGVRWMIPTVDEVLAIAKSRGFDLLNDIPITVTRDAPLHSRHAITDNRILHLRLS